MASKIRVLDDKTINQIAAGEVIENPSSVVKELVENSLDAEAVEICIEIRGGGRQLIRVTDNGSGMNRDDALLSLERHATSKLKRLEDLETIGTLGFRGEAVPSIASISKFFLLTRTSDDLQDKGTLIKVEGGRLLECSHCQRDPGTTIEVKDLFFNVPVRKKFQKVPAHDQNEILKVLTAQSLARPKLKLKLISDQKTLLHAPANQSEDFLEALKLRIQDVLGQEYLDCMLPIQNEKGSYKVLGYIGAPSNHRPSRQSQHLFVNNRPIASTLVSNAIREGYGPALPANRFPVFVLHLWLPSSEFDVNVHPQKREVRICREEQLRRFLLQSLEAVLHGEISAHQPSYSSSEHFVAFPQEKMPSFASYSVPEKSWSFAAPRKEEKVPEFILKTDAPPKVLACFRDYFITDKPPQGMSEKEGLCLADVKNVFARILYERSLNSLQDTPGGLSRQSLLVPYTLEFIPEDAEILRQNISFLNRLGFELREFAPRLFFVEAIPESFSYGKGEEMLKDLIASLKQGGSVLLWQKEQDQKIALAISRGAQHVKSPLQVGEAQELLKQLLLCGQPFFSPQGLPTLAVLSFEELASYFKK